MIGKHFILTLQISGEDGNIIAIEADRNVAWKQFLTKCVPSQPMIFIHNGVPLRLYQTPDILDLKDGDVILEMKVGASRLFESLVLVALQLHASHRSHGVETLSTCGR